MIRRLIPSLRCVSMFAWTLVCTHSNLRAIEFPGPAPGEAKATLADHRLTLENSVLRISWDLAPGRLSLLDIDDRISGQTARLNAPILNLSLRNGQSIGAAQFQVEGDVSLSRCAADPNATRLCERNAGWSAEAKLKNREAEVALKWKAVLRDGSNYVTQAVEADEESRKEIVSITWFDMALPDAALVGEVDGSPVMAGDLFFAAQHPLARHIVREGRVTCTVRCDAAMSGSASVGSAVVGVTPRDQRRRAFLYYVERERARPYQLFVHYNSWWDIAWGDRKMSETECLDVIRQFGEPLTRQRQVSLDSFCFDDGWDDNRTLWKFHAGFPRGFQPLGEAAKSYGSGLGVWLSPWGGYGTAKDERMKYGETQGFEANANGFSLAGPVYYQRFREACLGMIRDYGCNYFKFDGIALGVGSVGAGDQYAADVASLLRLITDLRSAKPDVFVNVTTGTWPSPYWLWYGDSIWRNGEDVGFFGEGSVRQQSITYRDMITHRMIVHRAPLYPLNSLMICSVVYGQRGTAVKMNYDVKDLADEVRMAFAGGTQCLELYMTPGLMKPEGWDVLAGAARWAREHRDVLVDSHWIGGDPGAGEPYGYASWAPRKGILALRNPAGRKQSLTISLARAFELTEAAPKKSELKSPWSTDREQPPLLLNSEDEQTFELKPFETIVLEAMPR